MNRESTIKCIGTILQLIMLCFMLAETREERVYGADFCVDVSTSIESVDGAEIIESGICGQNAVWTLYSNGKLYINGSGMIANKAFRKKFREGTVQVIINSGIRGIGADAFADCSAITEVEIADGVVSIENRAFENCSNLEKITIPGSMIEFVAYPSKVFDGCSKLKTAGPIGGGYNFEFGWSQKLPDNAFENMSSLTQIVLPETLEEIGNNVFSGCNNITTIKIPNCVAVIGDSAFCECSKLSEVMLPEKLVSLGGASFFECMSLEHIELPMGIIRIGENTFVGCSTLSDIIIPDKVQSIGDWAFVGCDKLKKVVVPANVTSIGNYVFSNCTNLKVVVVPSNVIEIGDGILEGTRASVVGVKGSYANVYADAENLPFLNFMNFEDVPKDVWYYEPVSFVYYRRIMGGISESSFGIDEFVSRAQIATILYRICGEPKIDYEAVFPDVPEGEWYTNAAIWARQTEIITGYLDNGRFGPEDKVNREQLAVILYRYAKYKGYDVSECADVNNYEDADQISEFAECAMRWAVSAQIITGKYNETQLEPQGNTKRAEMATIIWRFALKYDE